MRVLNIYLFIRLIIRWIAFAKIALLPQSHAEHANRCVIQLLIHSFCGYNVQEKFGGKHDVIPKSDEVTKTPII
jgi:hypothetical protein